MPASKPAKIGETGRKEIIAAYLAYCNSVQWRDSRNPEIFQKFVENYAAYIEACKRHHAVMGKTTGRGYEIIVLSKSRQTAMERLLSKARKLLAARRNTYGSFTPRPDGRSGTKKTRLRRVLTP
jgi:hypothetical protein